MRRLRSFHLPLLLPQLPGEEYIAFPLVETLLWRMGTTWMHRWMYRDAPQIRLQMHSARRRR